MSDHPPALAACRLALNDHVAPWVERLCADADALRVAVARDERGARVVDCGIAAPGSIAAGLLVAEICLGGYGRVSLRGGAADGWPTWIEVASSAPVLACLASQYAGWSLAASKEETGGKKFFSLGSGPGRALAAKEALYAELGWRDRAARGVLVLEVDRAPPPVVVDKILRDCALQPEQLTLVLTPTCSAAGTTQVVARVLEVALHKAHELGFALADIVDGSACAPLPVPTPDGVEAMGRTNDAILYGGRVHLSVRGSDEAARDLARRLPSRHAPDYGRSFAAIFRAAGFDFYKIDPALFAPAEVWVSNVATGRSWHGGAVDMALLRQLWLEEA
ncbi:MAG: methenyltetrahydromethanopterin cyclohydrolase [Burkholderiales bacterium]|nr:methenyltetrahydromethanopterin cyclohydrolase [Burkholderiales bacterium]MDE2160404.1 methenyltetrahydromethanopterin cyclohydrolase [Burkholderiales bacterium]